MRMAIYRFLTPLLVPLTLRPNILFEYILLLPMFYDERFFYIFYFHQPLNVFQRLKFNEVASITYTRSVRL